MAKKKATREPENKNAEIAQPERLFEYVFRQQDYPTYYVNNAQFASSDMDVRIDLCEIQEARTEGGIQKTLVTPKARVFMSWPFALRFVAVMNQQIENQRKKMQAAQEQMEKAKTEIEPNKRPS